MMLTSSQRSLSSSNLLQLATQLDQVNSELRNTIDSELDQLKEQERQLQTAMKIRTRRELINSMEKELEMSELYRDMTNNKSALMLTSNSGYLNPYTNRTYDEHLTRTAAAPSSSFLSTSLNNSTNGNFVSSAIADYQTLNLDNLRRSIDVSDDGLRKSHRILDKLIDEYSAQLGASRDLSNNVNEYLRSAANDRSFAATRQNVSVQDSIRPSVVYASTFKKSTAPSIKYRTKILPSNQYLNSQQTLRDDNLLMAKSLYLKDSVRPKSSYELNQQLTAADYLYSNGALNERELAKSIRDNYFYTNKDMQRDATLRRSLRATSANRTVSNMNDSKYLTLPLSKTLVHDKPWSYGHVNNQIYYPFRDSKIKRK